MLRQGSLRRTCGRPRPMHVAAALTCVAVLSGAGMATARIGKAVGVVPAAPGVVLSRGVGLVPVVPMAELLGAALTVKGSEITVTRKGKTVTFTLGSTTAKRGGRSVTMPERPHREAAAVYVPLVPLIEGLGGMVRIDRRHREPSVSMRGLGSPLRLPFLQGGRQEVQDLYVVNIDGTGLKRLTYQAGPDVLPDISPDGATFAYCRNGSVCVRKVRSPNVNVLLPVNPKGGILCFGAKFGPDGSRILYSMARIPAPKDTPGNEIRIINPDGTGKRTLAVGLSPHFSPDGKMIGFLMVDPGIRQGEVRLIDTDGRNRRTLCIGRVSDPIFSPDGKTVAITQYIAEKGISQVRLIDIKGGKMRNLGPGGFPVFSPDGAVLLFGREYDVAAGGTGLPSPVVRGKGGLSGGPWRFESYSLVAYVVKGPKAGTMYEPRYEERGFADHYASFSPDGKQVVFVREGEANEPGQGLWVMNVDRSNARRVMNFRGINFPSFTRDGRSIVCNWNGDLSIVKTDGTGRKRLTSDIGLSSYKFMPDGRRVLMLAQWNGQSAYYQGLPMFLP